MLKRMVPALYVADLHESKSFYCEMLGFTPCFEADWIVQLACPGNENIELILQPVNHALIPAAFQKPPQGSSIAFVVDDCDEFYKKALAMNLEIVQEPENEFYGQRRFLTVDPDGILIDVSSACEPDPEFVEKYLGADHR